MARLKAEYLGDTTSSTATKSQARLQQISNQLSPAMASPFSVDVVPQAPEDPLFGLMAAYKADTFDKKVDLGIGAYRDNNAKPWVLPVVKKVSLGFLQLRRLDIPILGVAQLASC
jgi:aspartate aminotransferase